ncbi:Uncharacterised protein [Mycobacteroides abscessus subsp. abscessus]|nr:Uncharacterised protein [Mycobacteroides abscessus subsp. abscessus]
MVLKSTVPGRPRTSSVAAANPSAVCTGITSATKSSVTSREWPKVPSVSTECQLSRPTNSMGPNKSQRHRLSHTTTRMGSSRNAATPNRLGASSPYATAVCRDRLTGPLNRR